MTRSKYVLRGDRILEVRDRRVMTSLEIWIYEDNRPISRHSALRLSDAASALAKGRDLLKEAMERAAADVQTGALPA